MDWSLVVGCAVSGILGMSMGLYFGWLACNAEWKEKLKLPDWFSLSKMDRAYRVYEEPPYMTPGQTEPHKPRRVSL